jgi:hypothetical protein
MKNHMALFIQTPGYSLLVVHEGETLYELKRLIRNAIMNEFLTHTMRRPTHFPGCKPLMLSQPVVLVSFNDITTDDNTRTSLSHS